MILWTSLRFEEDQKLFIQKWNENQAILSGDVMAFVANDCIAQAPADCMPEVLKIYNKVAREVCIGQQLDMDFEPHHMFAP